MKKKILIITDYYKPSIKGGGPIQSIKNLVDNLGNAIDFYILTSDRDLGDKKPFDSVIADEWIDIEKASIYYTDISSLNWRKVKKLIESIDCDILYLNSFFSFRTSVIPVVLHKFRKINIKTVFLNPRGQFSKGALNIKGFKKSVFIKLVNLFNLYNDISWHATTKIEKEDIQKIFGKSIDIYTANNLTQNYSNIQYEKCLLKKTGELKLVYIARIHPMKNLLQTLELLQYVEGNVEFNIYGPIEDNAYWNKCVTVLNKLNESINVNYLGQIANEKVNSIYKKNHVAILLTRGENFGHSISEALIGGCPVIISDRTPWRNLQCYNAGYDISLGNNEKLINCINKYVKMDNNTYQSSSNAAFNYAKNESNTLDTITSYYKMFSVKA